MSQTPYPTLYKRTSDGAVQIWRQEIDGHRYRTVSGQLDGKLVTSQWREASPKNVGRANATSAEEQARLEVEANYKKRRELAYADALDDIDGEFYFKPMLAREFSPELVPFGKAPVFSQPKLDGVRCILRADGAYSRKGKPIVMIPHIRERLAPLFAHDPDLVLDGELYNHDLKDDFNTIVSLVRKTKPEGDDLDAARTLIQYHVYDRHCAQRPFGERHGDLARLADHAGDLVHLVETESVADPDHLDALYGRYTEAGYEGQMVRISGPAYEHKRTKNLLKRKEFDDAEFALVGIEPGLGNRSQVAGYAICRLPDGRSFRAGIKGSFGFACDLLENRALYEGGSATVQFFRYTPDGIPRFPVAKAFFPGMRDL